MKNFFNCELRSFFYIFCKIQFGFIFVIVVVNLLFVTPNTYVKVCIQIYYIKMNLNFCTTTVISSYISRSTYCLSSIHQYYTKDVPCYCLFDLSKIKIKNKNKNTNKIWSNYWFEVISSFWQVFVVFIHLLISSLITCL